MEVDGGITSTVQALLQISSIQMGGVVHALVAALESLAKVSNTLLSFFLERLRSFASYLPSLLLNVTSSSPARTMSPYRKSHLKSCNHKSTFSTSFPVVCPGSGIYTPTSPPSRPLPSLVFGLTPPLSMTALPNISCPSCSCTSD